MVRSSSCCGAQACTDRTISIAAALGAMSATPQSRAPHPATTPDRRDPAACLVGWDCPAGVLTLLSRGQEDGSSCLSKGALLRSVGDRGSLSTMECSALSLCSFDFAQLLLHWVAEVAFGSGELLRPLPESGPGRDAPMLTTLVNVAGLSAAAFPPMAVLSLGTVRGMPRANGDRGRAGHGIHAVKAALSYKSYFRFCNVLI